MENRSIRVLLVEDDPDDIFFIRQFLSEPDSGKDIFAVEIAERLESGLELLERERFDVVLADLMLPESQGIDTFLRLRACKPDTPILVLTGLQDESMAMAAVRQGAQDYLVKGAMDARLLKRAIRYAIERNRLIVELRRVEQLKAEIKERRKLDQLKDQFLHSVSHELRSPLTIIKAAVCNMRDGLVGELSPPQRSLVQMADKNIVRLTKIIDNLLDLSRLESGRTTVNRRRIDVGPLLRDMAECFQIATGGRRIRMNLELEPGLPQVLADPDMLVQVISNLLDNATRYARSKVVLSAAKYKEPVPAGAASEKAPGRSDLDPVSGVLITVEDDGPGIPEERIPELFNKFVQINRPVGGSEYKGTGLGLAICKEIMELHQGKIWVESREGTGARFHALLPHAG